MRFLVAFKNDRGTSLKIAMVGGDGKEKEIWMSCSLAVYGFAKKTLRGNERDSDYTGDEVKVTYTQENQKYTCTRIEKIDGASETQSKVSTTGDHICADCGVSLKDGKYKKCYDCNKKNLSKSKAKSSNGNFRTPEEITKDEIGHMTARTMVALQGHVDPNNVTDVVKAIYKTYQELVK